MIQTRQHHLRAQHPPGAQNPCMRDAWQVISHWILFYHLSGYHNYKTALFVFVVVWLFFFSFVFLFAITKGRFAKKVWFSHSKMPFP